MVGRRVGSLVSGSGMAVALSFATHCLAPAGLSVSSHSWPNRLSKNALSQRVGVDVHVTSSPLVIASRPLPLPKRFFQPRP